MSILEAEGLKKHYKQGQNEIKALAEITLSVERGDFIAIMGASGSGKSTLLNLLGGLDEASDGAIAIDGTKIDERREGELTKIRRRKIGFVFQSFNLIPVLSALENTALPLLIDGIRAKEANRRASEMLTLVGLADRLTHFPDELSGGEQQRTAIARALVTKPAIVLADEPTGNLDSVSSEEIMKLLKRASVDQGQTIILVTHDPKDAAHADRIIFLKDGSITDDIDGQAADIETILKHLAG